MESYTRAKFGSASGINARHWVALLLVTGFLIATMNVASAVPVTPAGFLDDAGDSYFATDAAGIAIEVLDLADPASEFGFFFQSDPSTLIPIFDGTDIGPGQLAAIDFFGGSVVDLDGDGPTTFFAGSTDNIGFYLTIASALTLYSDPSLNTLLGGIDLFYAFEDATNPLLWALVFEADTGTGALQDISLNLVTPISAVPLPPTVYLMGSLIPILMFMSRRRKKAIGS